jgi:heterotetrameric sarcosine oxidase gamma subunit
VSDCVLEKSSVLIGVRRAAGRDGAGGQRSLRIGETRDWKLVQVAAFPTTATEVEQEVHASIGVDLPARVGNAEAVGSRFLLRTGPEQFWIVTQDSEDIAPALRSAVAPAIGSVTTLSHSRARIWIEGSHSREVLAKGLSIDLDAKVFGPNSFALTGLHHTPVMVIRTGATRFELYVLRTFAVWTWEWLTDAALPYGYDVDVPD